MPIESLRLKGVALSVQTDKNQYFREIVIILFQHVGGRSPVGAGDDEKGAGDDEMADQVGHDVVRTGHDGS